MAISQKKRKNDITTRNYSLSEILFICLSKWHWFVIALTITLSYAVYKNITTPPVYTRHTEVLIKSKDKSNTLSEQMENFASMGTGNSSTNAYNEIYTFRATETITETVRRLGLNIDYTTEGTFFPITLYGDNLPVKANLCNFDSEKQASFNIDINPDKSFKLYNFSGCNANTPTEVSGNFGSDTITLVSTPLGDIILEYNTLCRFDKKISITARHIGLQSAAARYGGRLSFNLLDENSDIITISISDQSIERADDILETLIQVYNENWVADKNKEATGTKEFIEGRLEYISNELDSIDNNISSFKSDNLLPDINSQSDINISKERDIARRKSGVQNELDQAEFFLRNIKNRVGENTLLPINSGISNSNINAQISSYNSTMINRNNLASKSSEDNPSVKDLDLTLSSMRAAIISSVETHIRGLKSQIAVLNREERNIQSEIARSPEQSTFLSSAEREQGIKEKIFLFLLQKQEENQLSQAFSAYKTRIITTPTGSLEPTAPQKGRTLLYAFAIGLLIPAVLLIIKEVTNSKVRGRKDLEHTNIPIAGEIPLFYTSRKEKKEISKKSNFKNRKGERLIVVVKPDNRNIINEAFRVLRTNIEFMTRNTNPKVCIYTSFNPGSGKTFCVLNTAISLAIKNNKILLIDGDLRRASLSEHIGSPDTGLSNYLAKEKNNINDIITPDSNYSNLHIIPVGTIPPNPTELLESERFTALIEEAKKFYDYILIDCPPVDIVADTHIIEKQATNTFFLVRAGLLERSMLNDIENIYDTGKLKNMSIILNGVDTKGSKYGYRYGYRYGYHYGNYTYGNK